MCWVGKNIQRIADKDISVFKVVWIIKNEIITSIYHPSFVWNLNKSYKTSIFKSHSHSGWTVEINDGFHCYNPKEVSVTIHGKRADIETKGHVLDCFTTHDLKSKQLAVMRCIIPAGTAYYENLRGEIVTEKLIPESYSLLTEDK